MKTSTEITTRPDVVDGSAPTRPADEAGWLARLGFIVPASNGVVEYEIARMLPPDVSAHFARAPHHPQRETRLSIMIEALPRLAEELAAAEVDAVSFACTTGSFADHGWEARALEAIRRAGCRRQGTTTTAVLAAIHALGAKRVTVVTPYPDDYNHRLVGYFEARGLSIVRLASLYSERPEAISPRRVGEFCVAHADRSADALFISCTKLRTLEILDDVERRLGMPAISAVGASLWQLIEHLALPPSPVRPGRLFSERVYPHAHPSGRARFQSHVTN